MVFKTRQKRRNLNIKLEISNCAIERVRDTMFLGVILDEVVKFNCILIKIGLLPSVSIEMFLVTNQIHSYNSRNSNTC